MTAEERELVEARLEERLQELIHTKVAMHRSDAGSRDVELAHVDQHPGDLGSEVHDEELSETTEIFFEEEERRIAEARKALEDGTYGFCTVCGKPIPPERLRAVPEAIRCLDDQRHFEGLHRQNTQPA